MGTRSCSQRIPKTAVDSRIGIHPQLAIPHLDGEVQFVEGLHSTDFLASFIASGGEWGTTPTEPTWSIASCRVSRCFPKQGLAPQEFPRQRRFTDRNPSAACDSSPWLGSAICRRSPQRRFLERSLVDPAACLSNVFLDCWQFAPWRRKGEQDQVNDCCFWNNIVGMITTICG